MLMCAEEYRNLFTQDLFPCRLKKLFSSITTFTFARNESNVFVQ